MSKYTDCLRDAVTSVGKNFDEVFDAGLRKEIDDMIEGMEDTIKVYETKYLDENMDISEQASELLKGTADSIEFLARRRIQDGVLTKLREQKLTTQLLASNESPEQMLRTAKDIIEGGGASAIHRKGSKEADFQNALRSGILDGTDGKFTEKVYKRLGSHLFNSKGNKDFYQRSVNAIHRLSHAEANDLTAVIDDLIPEPKERQAIMDIYAAIRKLNEKTHAEKVASGILIGKQKGYLWRKTYDAKKIRALSPADYADKMEELVDNTKFIGGFAGETAGAKARRKVMFEQMHGKFNTLQGTFSEESDAFTAFLMSRTKSRKLDWKSGDAEFQAFEAFGDSTDLSTLLSREINDSATAITNHSMFGSEPVETFNKVMDKAFETVKKSFTPENSQKYADDFQNTKTRSQQILTVMQQRPDTNYSWLGKMFVGLKYSQLFKLGSTAVATAPMDITTGMHTVMTDRGTINAFSATYSQVRKFSNLAAIGKEERHKLANMFGLFSNVADGTSVSRMNNDLVAADGSTIILEKMSQGAGKFLDTTGLSLQTHLSEMTNGLEASATLNMAIRGVRDGNINASLKETLSQAQFSKGEMKLLVDQYDKLKGVEGLWDDPDMFINPLNIFELDDSLFSGSAASAFARKNELHTKMIGFINGRAKQGTPQPTLANSFNLGKNTLTDADAFTNSLFTFKGTIMKMGTDFGERFGRAQRNMGTPAHSAMLAQYIGASAGVFMAVDAFSSALLDKEPAFEKLARGDMEGVLHNFINKTSPAPMFTDPIMRMIQARNMWGQASLVDSFTGPVGSLFRDFENIGKSKDKGKAAARFLRNHGPGAGHWMLRGAGRHGFGYDTLTGKEVTGDKQFIKGNLVD